MPPNPSAMLERREDEVIAAAKNAVLNSNLSPDLKQLSDFIALEAYRTAKDGTFKSYNINTVVNRANQLIEDVQKNPAPYVKKATEEAASLYGISVAQNQLNVPTFSSGVVEERKQKLFALTDVASKTGVNVPEIQQSINDIVTKNYTDTYTSIATTRAQVEAQNKAGSFSNFLKTAALMVAPFALPGVGAALGSALAPTAAAGTQAVIGNAIIQGALAEAQGGDFLKGAALSVASSALPNVNSSIGEALGGGTAANVAAGALTSGALADLAGGDFKQGALMGGISAGVNEAKLDLATDQLNSMEGGFGPYESNLPTELDVIAAFPELAPHPVFDTSFTPDYSLATGAPVIPDMGAQGIQVPTINELVDVVGQPVDYSLPIPNSGLGLQMPTAPNLDSMGGGQGLVIPVDGGVITEAGFIPDAYVPDLGDPNSFINKPAPNVEVNIPDLPAEQPKDISGELAALDLVKALAPFAVTAALAKDQPQTTTDEQTGYPILPIPSEWKAPEYSMAFTPSAALDFGSPDLLQGTQWANQQVQPEQMNYSLSDVMNTLNYQSVPFVQQQMQPFEQSFSVPDILQQFQTRPNVGMNDIIGGLNGRQVSISDIISGIQSQYGQKAAS